MEDWHEFKLNELGKVGRGKSKHRPRNEPSLFGGEYPFIQTGDIKSANFYVSKYSQTYNEKGLAQSKIWKKGTLCITIAANIAETAILGIDACFPDSIIGFIADKNKSDVRFIKYYFDILKIHLQSISQGTTQDNLSQEKLLKFSFIVPKNVEDQKRIASILSTYDELIENNTERIKLLEETSRELYKEWFVRLRFPGYKKTKFLKGIPADWKIRSIGEFIDYHIGGGWGNDVPDDYFNTSGYVIRGTDIPGIKLGTTNRDVYRFHKASNMKSRELLEGDIVFETAGGSEGQPLGRTCFITQELLDAYGDKVMAASFCKQIRTNSIPPLYLYYFLNYLYDSGLIEAFQTQSTGISNYQFGPFLKFQQIIIPNENLMQEFHNIALTIQKQIAILGQQNTELRQTRDRLLPRLIGGKLQVKLNTDCNTTKSTESRQVIDKPEKSTEDTKLKSNPFFQRRVLATYIIDRLKDEPTFGHVKLMKLMYLCEHLAEIETASHYHRDAAGPYDNRMIRSIDSQLKKAQWFECKKTGNKYQYTALPKKEEYKNWFSKYYSDKEVGIENLLHLFGKEKTEKAEMVATLYEAWRDLKDRKQLPTEQAIIYEVLNNWHESKQRISEERWLKCLQWMKEKNWIT